MAKRPSANVRHVPLALLALVLSPHAKAEWKFTPTVDLRENYSDNVNLQRAELAKAQFYTELAPGFSLMNNSPRWTMRSAYQRSFYWAAKDDVPGTQRGQQQLSANVDARLVEDLLFFDAAAQIGQQAISAFGPQVNNNFYSTTNRTEVRTWHASPFLRHRFGSTADLEVRYLRDSVDTGRVGMGNSDGDTLSFNLGSGRMFRAAGWNLVASKSKIKDSVAPDSTIENVNLNLRYRLGSTFTATASVGHDSYDYQSLGGDTAGASRTLGFQWTPSPRTSLTASAGRRYYGSTYLLNAQHRSRHTVWLISYNDAVTTSRSQFLLPSTIDTASMLDGLLTPTIPDPVKRAAAVQAYINATGLPPSLADNVNYFTNRFILQKQLQASVAFSTAHTSTVFSLYNTRREALSAVQTDSLLTGSQNQNLNDNTRQYGANAMLNWRINPRSSVILNLNSGKSISNSTGLETDNKSVRLGLTSQIRARLRGTVELRRVEGSTLGGLNDYVENGASASLSMQF
jgi:uncharacterized protein (PEP-CTERM system associated)